MIYINFYVIEDNEGKTILDNFNNRYDCYTEQYLFSRTLSKIEWKQQHE